MPSAEPGRPPGDRPSGGWRRFAPWTFQARLTLAIVAIVALTLSLVSLLVLNRLDAYFSQQQQADLTVRAETVAVYARDKAHDVVPVSPVVGVNGLTDIRVVNALSSAGQERILADRLGQADVAIRFGWRGDDGSFVPSRNGLITGTLRGEPQPGQAREDVEVTGYLTVDDFIPFVVEVTLSGPYTFRASTIATVTGLLAVIGLIALGVAVVVASILARRVTSPLRRLTEASRALAEGDLASRVPVGDIRGAPGELAALATQFNRMASRLEESVAIIRRDRDRSRDFLADVSHELRTPIAAMRTFNELLQEGAAADPDARAEFLESSRVQLERLDWLAQNLLELSKLDSGLVLLELRPDDLRGTVEQALDAVGPAARRRGVELAFTIPPAPLRVQHDAQRVGQAVSNLVGNAIKFTPRGGHVGVSVAPDRQGARIDVIDTGVGIDAAELPHIFDRFFRGSRANEARSSGSGLGLSIVKSIVDMHGGSIAVESRLGAGTRFTVILPRDPRAAAASPAARADPVPEAAGTAPAQAATAAPLEAATTAPAQAAPEAIVDVDEAAGQVAETSPSGGSRMNPGPAR